MPGATGRGSVRAMDPPLLGVCVRCRGAAGVGHPTVLTALTLARLLRFRLGQHEGLNR